MTLDTASDTRGSTDTIRIVDPATGEPVGEHRAADEAEAGAAVRRAVAAFPDWATTPPARRGELLRAAAHALAARADEVAELNTRETGKTPADAAG
ncbi:MAG TPA: aldehyde dehydrogenase family protein, partial [Amnibacterium sp.]|nr:aldehyde dehydrogenase family protein [Amnibacterium sp.]